MSVIVKINGHEIDLANHDQVEAFTNTGHFFVDTAHAYEIALLLGVHPHAELAEAKAEAIDAQHMLVDTIHHLFG